MSPPTTPDETSRAILFFLYEGRTHDEILTLHPQLTLLDISRACGEGLRALEEASTLRVETRAERIERIRLTHPRAFEPWSEDEDARLALRWNEGGGVAELARSLGRPRGAVTMRLEKLLGAGWKTREPTPRPRKP